MAPDRIDIAGWEQQNALEVFARLIVDGFDERVVATQKERLTEQQARMVTNLIRRAAETLED